MKIQGLGVASRPVRGDSAMTRVDHGFRIFRQNLNPGLTLALLMAPVLVSIPKSEDYKKVMKRISVGHKKEIRVGVVLRIKNTIRLMDARNVPMGILSVVPTPMSRTLGVLRANRRLLGVPMKIVAAPREHTMTEGV